MWTRDNLIDAALHVTGVALLAVVVYPIFAAEREHLEEAWSARGWVGNAPALAAAKPMSGGAEETSALVAAKQVAVGVAEAPMLAETTPTARVATVTEPARTASAASLDRLRGLVVDAMGALRTSRFDVLSPPEYTTLWAIKFMGRHAEERGLDTAELWRLYWEMATEED